MSKNKATKIKNEIKALIKTAETGEQWAQICYLEKLLVDNGYKYQSDKMTIKKRNKPYMAQKQKESRARKKQAGLRKFESWVAPELYEKLVQVIKDFKKEQLC